MTPNDEKLVWCLSDLQEEPLDWLWPGRLVAGKTTVIDGDDRCLKAALGLP